MEFNPQQLRVILNGLQAREGELLNALQTARQMGDETAVILVREERTTLEEIKDQIRSHMARCIRDLQQ